MISLLNLEEMKTWNENFQEQYQLFNNMIDRISDISYKFRCYSSIFGYSNSEPIVEKDTGFRTTPNFVYIENEGEIYIKYTTLIMQEEWETQYTNEGKMINEYSVHYIPQSFVEIYFQFPFDLYINTLKDLHEVENKKCKLESKCMLTECEKTDIRISLFGLKNLIATTQQELLLLKKKEQKLVPLLKEKDEKAIEKVQKIHKQTKILEKKEHRLNKIYKKKISLKQHFKIKELKKQYFKEFEELKKQKDFFNKCIDGLLPKLN